MPYIYNTTDRKDGKYLLPSLYIDTDTMELIAVQSVNDPVNFIVGEDYELITEITEV